MPTENVSSCPVCGSPDKSLFQTCKDHFVSGESFSISRCNSCGFCFTDPRPALMDSTGYYDSEKYVSHSKTSRGITNALFHRARGYTLTFKKRLVAKYACDRSILDYGCGTGDFLSLMKANGWITLGIEPNSVARKHAIEKHALDVYDETALASIPDHSLGIITLWHVLEHIYPLKDRISSFHEKLNDDGTLIVAVPNMDSYDAKHYGQFWAAYDLPRHIYHFVPDTMIKLMSEAGFAHVKSNAMVLDAFYISLLSEKYKYGSNNFIRSMFLGLLSNLSAFWGNNNYSSLIYIFKKAN